MSDVHRLTEIWQERPGEVSYKCACGTVFKHQQFGPVPVCPDDPKAPEPLTVYTSPPAVGRAAKVKQTPNARNLAVSRMIRVPIRLEASGYFTLPSGTPLTLDYIREHWADFEIENVINSRQIGSIQTLEEESSAEKPTPVDWDDVDQREKDRHRIEHLLVSVEDRLYGLERAEREGAMEKTIVSEAAWSALSAVRELGMIVRKMRKP